MDVVAESGQGIPMTKRKAMIARRYVSKNAPKIAALADLICSGDKSTFADYEALVGTTSTDLEKCYAPSGHI